MAGKTLHEIINEMDHDIIISDTFDPIDAIIDAFWDIREIDVNARNNNNGEI